MLQKFRSLLKNEKGLTLIELLAVVVILGIIAAIAIPSIGGLIDNSKKDAHVANAQQMASSAKLAIAGVDNSSADYNISLKYLEDNNYIETLKDPDGNTTTYKRGTGTMTDTTGSYVVVEDGKVTAVKLVSDSSKKRGVQVKDTNGPITIGDLNRDAVNDTKTNP